MENKLPNEAEKYYRLSLMIFDNIKSSEIYKRDTYLNLSLVTQSFKETMLLLAKVEAIDKEQNNPTNIAWFYLVKGANLYEKGKRVYEKKYLIEAEKAIKKV